MNRKQTMDGRNSDAAAFVKRILGCLGCLAGIITMAGCHTVEGVGEDVQHAGYHIEEAAERVGD
ncbi:entericidin A/B family lipoprotein [Haloferula sp. A504]|uniref:entericidin A/B family lipoprotein n=1 Tax=Haloferula sp. A504 TaxID=3373601 RepID=UPI0031BE7EE7|nr:entericidin A/B family lipoprotein [Verrucomicrobiaceae bacterium E54]